MLQMFWNMLASVYWRITYTGNHLILYEFLHFLDLFPLMRSNNQHLEKNWKFSVSLIDINVQMIILWDFYMFLVLTIEMNSPKRTACLTKGYSKNVLMLRGHFSLHILFSLQCEKQKPDTGNRTRDTRTDIYQILVSQQAGTSLCETINSSSWHMHKTEQTTQLQLRILPSRDGFGINSPDRHSSMHTHA